MWLFWTLHYNQRVYDTTRSSTYGQFRTDLSVLVLGLNIGYNQQSIFRIKSGISSVPDHGCHYKEFETLAVGPPFCRSNESLNMRWNNSWLTCSMGILLQI